MTTMFRKTSAVLAIAALASFTPQIGFAAEKLGQLVIDTKPKLNVGQFVGNCQTIGGTVSDGGSNGVGGHSVTCSKDNGLDVTCDFSANQPTNCTGTGPRPQ